MLTLTIVKGTNTAGLIELVKDGHAPATYTRAKFVTKDTVLIDSNILAGAFDFSMPGKIGLDLGATTLQAGVTYQCRLLVFHAGALNGELFDTVINLKVVGLP